MRLSALAALFAALGLLKVCHAWKVDSALIQGIQSNGPMDILVNFEGGNRKVIETIEGRSFRSRESKVKALTQGLQDNSVSSQGSVQEYVSSTGASSQSFWSSNQMVVRGANLNLVQGIADFKQVSKIQALPKSSVGPIPSKAAPQATEVQWGVKKIAADKVWDSLGVTGEGVVVANIDTGVRVTHEALKNNWRSDRGWWDPYNKTDKPNDQNGHGTHTMGTIAGALGIGVAPGAKWIACRGCNSSGCDGAALLECGQWILKPWTLEEGKDQGDASAIPDVVSNSWGSIIPWNDWYNPTIEAWKAAGILHAFSAGNSGPACPSVGSPADQQVAFAVGSTDKNDRISYFSSRKVFLSTRIKPEIAAPGTDVYSAWFNEDTAYKTISGTSMACPHVAGTMALMVSALRKQSKDPRAKITQERALSTLVTTTDTKGLTLGAVDLTGALICGTASRYPNYYFGYGRLNALNSVNATINNSQKPQE